jgi:hypothetical protein
VPNLSADRAVFVSWLDVGVDVRRLMYQTLICRILGRDRVRDHARSLAAALDSELLQGTPDTLVNGMRTDSEADGDLLAAVVSVDQQQAFDLSLAEASNGRSGVVIPVPLFNAI